MRPSIPSLLLAVLMGGASGSLAAQAPLLPDSVQPTGPEASADDDGRAPQAIALADLPARADADERFARMVASRAADTGTVAGLEPALRALEASIDAQARQVDAAQLYSLPVLRLESLDRHWAFDARQFAHWKEEFQAATGSFAGDAADVSRRLAAWRATRQAPPPGSLPAALSDRIDDVTAELESAEQALSAPLAAQIALGRRANDLDSRIQAGRRSVGEAIAHIDRRLLQLDAPPLWRATGGVEQGGMDVIVRGMEIEAAFAREYSAANVPGQRGLNVLQVLLLPLLLWLWWRARSRGDDAAGGEATPLALRRPVSCWILLSMIGSMVFEPDAPLLLQQVAMIVAVVPVLRLLPPGSRRLLGWWPYLAVGFFLLLRLSFLLLDSAVLYRWYQLVLAVGAIASTLWLLWRAHVSARAGRTRGRREQLARVLAWAGIVLLALSILANVAGNVSLAEMLVGGVVDSGYMALLLYAAFNVFGALLEVFFEHPSAAGLHLVRIRDTRLRDLLRKLLAITAAVGWVVFTLQRFRLFRPIYGFVHAVLTHEFAYGEFALSLGDVLAFVLAVFIAFWVASAVRVLLRDQVLSRMSLPRGVDNSVSSLAYYALILVGLLAALSVAGFKVGQLALLFGALGVGIGLGLQDVVKNFVSGLILMFERPVQPGDAVDVDGTSGLVRDIGMRATTIRTFEGADVVVPNGMLVSGKVTNWTLRDRFSRMEVTVGVAYGSDVDQVASLLEKAARQTPKVSANPPPVVLFRELGDSALNFLVRAWTGYDDHQVVRSALLGRIYRALNEAGIEIPYPQQDLNLRGLPGELRDALERSAAGKDGPAAGVPPASAGGNPPAGSDVPGATDRGGADR